MCGEEKRNARRERQSAMRVAAALPPGRFQSRRRFGRQLLLPLLFSGNNIKNGFMAYGSLLPALHEQLDVQSSDRTQIDMAFKQRVLVDTITPSIGFSWHSTTVLI